MNPPSEVLGGGVHGKVCWLIAYSVLNMNCCRALTVNLQKVFYNSQASVGDRQYTIILFISIIFLPTILNNLNDRERGRHYHFHFVGF